MPAKTPDEVAAQFTEALLALGFSQYESRCYVGLLGPGPQTGYAVSKATGVPQPKVYEALRKLVSRGAARQLSGEPTLFAAVPPQELLDDLESSFDDRIGAAREVSESLEVGAQPLIQEPVAKLADHASVVAAGSSLLAAANRRVYLSATSTELNALRQAVQGAAKRGVDVVVLCFGKMPFQAAGVRVFRHASTDGALFRHHQSRHVALVADSRETLFGLAPDGKTWSGIQTTSEPIIAAVKGYIRHDIDMQRVYADFRTELIEAYGPGLQELRAEPGAGASGAQSESGAAQAG
jgi:HTH-type transcriptional regulator, sugar sensing transcriptional regulator